jgi:hypothetical protein
MDYAKILPRLYIGSHPATVEDIQTLQQMLSVTAILNLQADEDMRAIRLDFKPLETHSQRFAPSPHARADVRHLTHRRPEHHL